MGAAQFKSATKEVTINDKEQEKKYNMYVKAPEQFQNDRNDTSNYNIQSITNIIIILFLILFIILSFYLMCSKKIIYK